MKVFKTILQIGGVVGSIAAIGAAALFADSFGDKQDKILETVEYINVEQSMMAAKIEENSDSLDEIKAHQEVQDQHMRDMAIAAEFYIKNQRVMTEKSMEEALSAILKKNIDLTDGTVSQGPD